MMQGLHQQQQQLAALLSAALPQDSSTTATTATATPASTTAKTTNSENNDDDDDSARLSAINSLHRAILYPPNSLLVSHSASFLSQGLSQLLTDKSYAIRQSAATAYGALCAVVCAILIGSNGRQNHVMLGSIVDRFISWALPLLSNGSAGNGTTELALEGLREFLSVGDVVGIERYALPILKACQELLEDERTSLSLLHRLLGVLTLISIKFSRFFQPHFLDIVDLLLGWVLVPDLAESDRRVIMDSFLQFQKHWVGNLQFSLGLLSKFLGDMDALVQDGSRGTPPQFRRLLALLSCFTTVLQSTASGLLEMNLLEQISESLITLVPRLLGCLSMVGRKFGWAKWTGDLWKCLTLLAEILCEKFSTFYPLALDILFQSLDTQPGAEKITSFQVHGVLKTNLQLLSLQKLGLFPSTAQKVLQFDAPISQLRLHPNHVVTGSSAATYIFLLQHGNDEVVQQAIGVLIKEMELLKDMLNGTFNLGGEDDSVKDSKSYSKLEFLALMKFDLKVLLTCVSLGGGSSLICQPEIAAVYLKRSDVLASFIVEKLDPFNLPIQAHVELQVNVIQSMERLTAVEFLSRWSIRNQISQTASLDGTADKVNNVNAFRDEISAVIIAHIRKYCAFLIKALNVFAPLAVKLVALEWIQKFAKNVIAIYENSVVNAYFDEAFGFIGGIGNIIFSVFDAAFDSEPKVRAQVALVLEVLLQARLVHPICFYPMAEVVLEKLGDPHVDINNSFVRLLSHILPMAMFACGLHDHGTSITCRSNAVVSCNGSNLNWKQVFALKQLRKQLHSQQLVSILSYISQRWKVPLSSWIQRLIHSSRSSNDLVLGQLEETQKFVADGLSLDIKQDDDVLERICSVNNLAGAWWAIHEAARYCIATRLRTNLGGPTQTFAALERMLLDIAHVLQLDIEQNDGNLSIIGSSGAHLLPMRLLLDFVEALKKTYISHMKGQPFYHVLLARVPCSFVQTRRFARSGFLVYELKSILASSLKDKSRAQASENLHSIKDRLFSDIMRVLRHMALALCKSHEPKALIGLHRWASVTFSSLLMDENQSLNHNGISGPFAWITGLAYQAEGQYEKAAAHFTHLLQNEESLSSMGSDGVQFAISRIIESYTAVSDWKSLESWLSELQKLRSRHAGKSYSGALTTAGNEINAIHALARFDEGDFQAAWSYLHLTPKSSGELTLDPKVALQRSEQMLLQAMLFLHEGKFDKVQQETCKAKSMLEEMLSVLPLDGLSEAAPFATQLHCIFVVEGGNKLKDNHAKSKEHQSILSSYVESIQSSINRVDQDCNPWLKLLRVYRTNFPTSPVTLKLSMSLSSLARKQGNLMLATRLNNYLRDHALNCSEERNSAFLLSKLQYEDFMLLHADNKFEDAFANLWAFVRPCMVSSASMVSNSHDNILKAKACLKLSEWLRRDYPDLSLESIVLKMLTDFNGDDVAPPDRVGPLVNVQNFSSKPSLGVIIEEIVGTATKLSTQLCSTMGKAWISYASWCFSQARDSLLNPRETVLRSCSFSPALFPEVQPDRFKLTEDERTRVQSVVLQLFQHEDDDSSDYREGIFWLDSVQNSINNNPVVEQVIDLIEAAAGAHGGENSSGDSLSVTLASQLRTSFLNANAGLVEANISAAVDYLVSVWWSLRRRRVSLFSHAARGFMQYLTYSSIKVSDSQLVGFEDESLKQKTGSYTLRATLYFLHIFLNFGVELRDAIEPALSTIPLLPWQEVTPQLFARLSSHPEQVVRKQLEGLLMMLAKLSPWSIVYPTLVDVNTNEEKPSEELQHILGCLAVAINVVYLGCSYRIDGHYYEELAESYIEGKRPCLCCMEMQERELYPKLIQDVQLMINELENVTVLWEELWLSTLQDLHAGHFYVMRRINVLKGEAARIAENATLSQNEKNKINAAKYSAMMAPIVVALERRLASTSRIPETPHELWFHQEYRERLKSAILSFKSPPASAAALGEVWRPFDDIAASLASYQRKSSIILDEVAPQLALLSFSDVPMPGLEKQITISESDRSFTTSLHGIVTIASFCEQVTILSTKTKPKKLAILGSDGQKYTYLLKGREDLRLDARIMQLLQAINGFLRSSSAARRHLLDIRYYSVTPISGRAGLIQWVDNVVSIYSVFKSWQNREQLVQLTAMAPANTKILFLHLFPDQVICSMRKVLLDLMKEVPRQLLHLELWCASEGFKAFSSKLRRYSGSVAAMSIVGHILGLGDRHLDNILMDFCSGDIVHIDYNVCFDKGQRLKVPEIVPFRLTQMLEAALGLTGVEGTFRANCEAVVGVLRKNKDVLLMLLEVFVWDPLVEWTRGDFLDEAAIGGEERKGMELAVSLSLFASRVQEIRVPLQEHHDILLATLPAVESALERFANVLNQYERASALFYRADQERSSLILHETSAKSIVTEATCNSEKTRASFEIQTREFTQAKAVISEKAQEVATWMEQHGRVLDALRSNLLPEIDSCINLSSMADALSLTSAVLVAGIPLTIVPEPTQAQCQDMDREVSQLIAELDLGLSSALTGIQAYSSALQRFLPLNYVTTSAVHGWAQVLQLSSNSLSSDLLSLVRNQAAELVAKVHADDLESIKHIHDDLCLKVDKFATEIHKVEEECAELVNSIGSDTESKAKDRLLSAFMKYMQFAGLVRKEDTDSSSQPGQLKYDATRDARLSAELEDKEKVLTVLNIAVSSLYNEVRHRVLDIFSNSAGGRHANDRFRSIFCEFEEQVEKCVLVAGFFSELRQFIGGDMPSVNEDVYHAKFYSERNWASIFKTTLLSCKSLVGKMTEGALLDVMRSAVSLNSEVMDAFGLISQIRGSIDTACEQFLEVELERESLVELEKNYFVKVGLITEQQLALEEAAMKGRDHLSWEEAEELASQEEACRAQLDQLHQTWNQREVRTSSLVKRETDIKSALVSSECHFQSILSAEEVREPQVFGSKELLSILIKPFSELESVDKVLSSGCSAASLSNEFFKLADLMSSGYSMSEYIWKFGGLLKSHLFFIWKVCIVDSFLDSCMHDVASFVDQNLGFDQLFNIVKRKLEIQLHEHVGCYLKERVAPAFLAWLDKENEQLSEATKELSLDLVKKDIGAVRKVQLMLQEYCNAHETARAARSAASAMERQVNELKEALHKTSLEIVQLEWMYDGLAPSHNSRVTFQKFLPNEDKLHSMILNLSRHNLLEGLQSSITKIARSMDCLQACERNSVVAEGQLERAMGWACGGPNSSTTGNTSTKTSGIPLEFHDHLIRRRQLLWEAREKASDILKICMSILEFEASRDGIFRIPGHIYPARSGGDGRTWQQAYLNALIKLEVSYHSFTRTEQEWKLAQSSMEAASNGLYSATTELCIASLKAKSASEDLQNTVLAMRDCAYEASVALSTFSRISKGHTALTSESGTMLEEVLAITDDLHDVHSLGKEAVALHCYLMEDLSKANAILLPLESLLSKDVTAMTDAMNKERETKLEISPIHGQAIYQSYCLRIKEAIQTFKPLVPSLASAVKGLHSMLTRLAQTASLHAGNLHKALEGLGESQDVKSQGISLSGTDLDDGANAFNEKGRESFSMSDNGSTKGLPGDNGLSLQDKGWISPPDSVYSSSSESAITSAEASLPDSLNDPEELIGQSSCGSGVSELNEHLKSLAPPSNEAVNVPIDSSQPLDDESSKGKFESKNDEVSSLNKVKIEDENQEAPHPNPQTGSRVAKGKNAYAMSVLRRVDMKIDGQDIANNRKISIEEQVDYLLKQAMSVDNLCNMYEGWTPWI
ncbi:unnamed protein product [Dovyalis caffra]|uniref:non-specific serine/threonine protein kinase n=1 Tax=Dovyalis caffra TaxID=77055 RepID=A0AAV1RAF9_9ROSI|nr:unnamed protein product [Dovyalis caffra]